MLLIDFNTNINHITYIKNRSGVQFNELTTSFSVTSRRHNSLAWHWHLTWHGHPTSLPQHPKLTNSWAAFDVTYKECLVITVPWLIQASYEINLSNPQRFGIQSFRWVPKPWEMGSFWWHLPVYLHIDSAPTPHRGLTLNEQQGKLAFE